MSDEYIYKVYESGWKEVKPVLMNAKIIKEGKQRIVTERTGLAFHCRVWHNPEMVHRTPEAAWAEYEQQAKDSVEAAVKALAQRRKMLALITPEQKAKPAVSTNTKNGTD